MECAPRSDPSFTATVGCGVATPSTNLTLVRSLEHAWRRAKGRRNSLLEGYDIEPDRRGERDAGLSPPRKLKPIASFDSNTFPQSR
jgi:hypothetical protein